MVAYPRHCEITLGREPGELRFEVSHPNDKNKDVVRMGHPGKVGTSLRKSNNNRRSFDSAPLRMTVRGNEASASLLVNSDYMVAGEVDAS